MNLKEIIRWVVGATFNLLVIVLLVRTAWGGNDKAIILMIVVYPALLIVNLLVWLVLKLIGSKEAPVYKTLALCLIVLFFPVIFIAMLY